MKNLDHEMISLLQVLIDKRMDKLEQAIEQKRTSPFTLLYLSKYAEIDSILRDMKSKLNK
jgi:hypothetical protein